MFPDSESPSCQRPPMVPQARLSLLFVGLTEPSGMPVDHSVFTGRLEAVEDRVSL